MQYFVAVKSKENSPGALEAARRYSPNIEIVDETTLVFDLTGSKAREASKIAAELREKFEAVAVSENLGAALLLARHAREEEFRVQSSGFREGPRDQGRGTSEFEVESSSEEVSSFKFQVSSSGKQTWNLEPETWNSARNPERETRNPPLESAGERESGCSSKQTLNFELETLNRLPLEAISRKAEFLDLMDSWAVHDLGSFAALPEDEMVARFGLEIVELLKQAKGEAFRAPNWNVKDDKFFWEKELEGAIETIEPLNFVLSKGVAQIFRNLNHVGLSTQSAKITLRGRKKKKVYRIRIVFPTKNRKLWIRQIVTRIELDTPEFNIDRVEIVFRSTKPRTVQNNLYSGAVLEPENLDLIVSKLKKVVGLTKIGVPRLRDAWRKRFYMTEDLSALIAEEKFRVQSSEFRVRQTGDEENRTRLSKQTLNPEPETLNPPADEFQVSGFKFQVRETDRPVEDKDGRKPHRSDKQTRNQKPETRNSILNSPAEPLTPSFYYLPQPVKARVFFEGGEPKALLIKGKREMVKTSGGPWRMDAEWYEPKGWQRDEWDIETETGAVYRVYVDKNGEAFVDGGYD